MNDKPMVESAGSELQVIYYDSGQEAKLDNSVAAQAIADECKRLLQTADGSFRRIVVAEDIAKLKKEAAVEVRYKEVEIFSFPVTRKKVDFKRLIVPLRKQGTIFYWIANTDFPEAWTPEGNFKEEAIGVVSNSKGIDNLRELLRQAGFPKSQ